jgi:soluble lytic murein transglycosylase-like protein
MKLLTPQEAIKIGVTKYLDEYEDAVNVLWKHEKEISPNIDIVSFLIAQAVQESRFDSKAVSPAGAVGLAQFMPATAKQAGEELKTKLALFKDGFDRENPIQSIWAQVYYMNKLYGQWTTKRSNLGKLELAFASYNAGLGNILDAQKASKNLTYWNDIKIHLSKITDKNSLETISYVDYIIKYASDVQEFRKAKNATY